MRTLHVGLRVTDLQRSLAFYTGVGYEVIGSVPESGIGHLTMLKLPGDEFVSLELVHDAAGPVELGTGLSHLVVQVADMDDAISRLAAAGIDAEDPVSPDGSDDFRTSWLTDPDGRRIELVQWPAGHPDGLSSHDWED